MVAFLEKNCTEKKFKCSICRKEFSVEDIFFDDQFWKSMKRYINDYWFKIFPSKKASIEDIKEEYEIVKPRFQKMIDNRKELIKLFVRLQAEFQNKRRFNNTFCIL